MGPLFCKAAEPPSRLVHPLNMVAELSVCLDEVVLASGGGGDKVG